MGVSREQSGLCNPDRKRFRAELSSIRALMASYSRVNSQGQTVAEPLRGNEFAKERGDWRLRFRQHE